ncbi:MAG TPA: pentapeptide repeat-containing protein [Pirellulales bacterium]|nr:pentapeptide repeat-containing protein [Pirellulales bacterium]
MTPTFQAPVRPRVISPETGDLLLLEDEAADWLEANDRGAFEIVGGPGAGKSTSLALLAAALGRGGVQFLDEPSRVETLAAGLQGRLIYTTSQPLAGASASRQLASWSDDELLEYVLAVHPSECASVMARVRAMPERRRLHGSPQVWRLVLDELARDERQDDFREIITQQLAARLTPREATYALAALLGWEGAAVSFRSVLAATRSGCEALGWLRHRIVQTLLAAWYFPQAIEADDEQMGFLAGPWPHDLLAETGRRLAKRPAARRSLEKILGRPLVHYHRVAASLLHAADCDWRPQPGTSARLAGAVFTGAIWPGIDLSGGSLRLTDFSGADLSRASLKGAGAEQIVLSGAKLAGANLEYADLYEANAAGGDLSQAKAAHSVWKHAHLQRANLSHADFRNADLTQADFTGANLTGAWLNEARLDGAILSRANLSSADLSDSRLHRVRLSETVLDDACLEGADLTEADLEFLALADARLEDAKLIRANLTGSHLPRAKLRGADLQQAGLADVQWEFADLRDADFTNASFHLGSSRSGLVGSPIACEGSRTGFYTDDFEEQGFKSPEEIRKANLRGADLRGATVEGADFYLVDLRDAKYDARQAQHFARCKAILYDHISG